MKNFFVITNKAKAEALDAEKQVTQYLKEHGAKVTSDSTPGDFINKERYTDINCMPSDTECVIVLGGDGTILHAACDLADATVPLMGINLGTMGYLAAIEQNDIVMALEKLLHDDYEIEDRMMIYGRSEKDGEIVDEHRALNEIVVTGEKALQIANVSIYVNGKLLHNYSADGIIIATPTGSTGYNLSAGGPIVSPSSDMIIVTPICSHSMHNRSIILSPEDEIRIEVNEGRFGAKQELVAVYDASHRFNLYTGDSIIIRKSHRTTGLIKVTQESFLDTLHNKLKDS